MRGLIIDGFWPGRISGTDCAQWLQWHEPSLRAGAGPLLKKAVPLRGKNTEERLLCETVKV